MSRGANTDVGLGVFAGRGRTTDQSSEPVILYPPQCGIDPRDDNQGNFGFIKALGDRQLPRVTIRNDSYYAVPVPADRKIREFLRGIVPGLQAGEVHRIEEWCEILQKAGIGHKKKGSDQVKKIGEATARFRWREVAYQTRLPLISMATSAVDDVDQDEEVSQGFGLAQNRTEVQKSSASLRRRAARMREVAAAGRQAIDSAIDEGAVRIPGLTPEQQVALLAALRTRPHKNEQLAMVIATGRQLHELKGSPLTPEQSAIKERLVGSQVRQLVHDARLLGFKICAGPTGYWSAESDDEMRDFCAGLDARADLVQKRAEWTDEAGAFNFPETAEEKAERARIINSQFRAGSSDLRGPSPEYLASEDNARRAQVRKEERDEEEMILMREQATAYLDKKSHDPAYLRAQAKVDRLNSYKGTGISPGDDVPRPTDAERQLVRRVRNARKVLQARNPRQLPRAEKGAAPMPWERPAVGSSPKGKDRRKEPQTANASEVLAQAERRQGGKVKDDEPIVVPF